MAQRRDHYSIAQLVAVSLAILTQTNDDRAFEIGILHVDDLGRPFFARIETDQQKLGQTVLQQSVDHLFGADNEIAFVMPDRDRIFGVPQMCVNNRKFNGVLFVRFDCAFPLAERSRSQIGFIREHQRLFFDDRMEDFRRDAPADFWFIG